MLNRSKYTVQVFIRQVSLVISSPVDKNEISADPENQDSTDFSQVDLSDPNAINVMDAVTSITELTDDQKSRLQVPLAKLVEKFNGSLFGSLFSYIMKRLQNPAELAESEFDNAELFKKTPDAFKALISTLQKMNDEVVRDSQEQFNEIFEILGDSKFAVFFREILTTLNMRHQLLQFANMGDAFLKNLPTMLKDASKMSKENVEQLLQNPGMAALMPGFAGIQKSTPGDTQTPQKVDPQMLNSLASLTAQPVEAVNAVQSIANRLRLKVAPRVPVPRLGAMQQRMIQQNLPPYRPSILDVPKKTMSV